MSTLKVETRHKNVLLECSSEPFWFTFPHENQQDLLSYRCVGWCLRVKLVSTCTRFTLLSVKLKKCTFFYYSTEQADAITLTTTWFRIISIIIYIMILIKETNITEFKLWAVFAWKTDAQTCWLVLPNKDLLLLFLTRLLSGQHPPQYSHNSHRPLSHVNKGRVELFFSSLTPVSRLRKLGGRNTFRSYSNMQRW